MAGGERAMSIETKREEPKDGIDAVDHYSWKQVYRACGVRGWRP